MDKLFYPTPNCAYGYVSMLGLKLIHEVKGAPGIRITSIILTGY